MSSPPMVLQVPLTISGDKVTVAGTPAFGKPESTAKALENSKSRLAQLRSQLKLAKLEYQKTPSAIVLKKIETIRDQIRALLGIMRKQRKGAEKEYRRILRILRRKTRELRRRVRAAVGNAKKPLQVRLDRLMNKYFDLRINRAKRLLAKNRSNVATMRRVRLRRRDRLRALAARMKTLTIPNPLLNARKMKLVTLLRRVRNHLRRALRRQRRLIRWLNRLKALKNRYNSRRMLQKAAAGAMGSIPQALKGLQDTLRRHEQILLRLSNNSGSLNERIARTRKQLAQAVAQYKKLKGSSGYTTKLTLEQARARVRMLKARLAGLLRLKGIRRRRRCGNLKIARRRLRRAVRMIRRLKKQPANQQRDIKIAKWRKIARRLRRIVRRIIKCKGLILCGNLRRARRNLRRARVKFAIASKAAIARPSDEAAQKDRNKYRARIKFHKRVLRKIWRCICRRAHKRYRLYKKLYEKRKSAVFLRRLKKHRRMIKRCNCRNARINFFRAKRHYAANQAKYLQNPQDTTAQEKIAFFLKRMTVHYDKMKKLRCRLPKFPTVPEAVKQAVPAVAQAVQRANISISRRGR